MTASRVARLVLDRPDRANALDAATVERLHDGLAAADATGAEAVVIEARGRSFCAGLDLTDLDLETDASLLHRLVRLHLLLERVRDSRALVVAVVQGPAVGAGADLVLAAHARVALPRASLRFPGAGFGAVLGTARLAAETSPAYAAELGLTGRRVDRDEAARRGIWQTAETTEDAEDAVTAWGEAAALLPGPTGARLRAASAGAPARDPLGDLVRSLSGEPGLADRVRAYRARTTAPAHQGTPSPEGVPA